MRIVRNLLLVVAVACCSLPAIQKDTITANAANWNDYSIHQGCAFDVDVVNDEGGFDHKGCYNDFESAKNAMNQLGQDAVVRNSNSASPTKIVAMVNGLVVNNPYRRFGGAYKDQTQRFYSNSDFTGSNTYTRQYQNAKYTGTAYYNGNGYGSVGLLINGFYGYVNSYDCDLIPIKYVTNNLPITLGGGGEGQYVLYPKMNYYYIDGSDMVFQPYWIWSDYESKGQTYAVSSGASRLPKADWMTSGTTYYSYDGYTFYTDQAMNTYAGTYYNYYQFLPLRTKSNLSASDLQNYLNSVGHGNDSVMSGNAQAFIDAQNKYGVNALMVYAMACHESAHGTSYYATTRANLFGWNAVDSNPDQASSYNGIYSAVEHHMGENLNGYLDIDDGRHFGMAVGNKGNGFNVCYASDTYWGIRIASIAYSIDKLAGLKDLNKIQLGVVSTDNGVYFSHDTNGGKWYTTINDEGMSYGGYNPRAYPVPVLSESNGYYKTQTSDHLTNGRLTRAKDSNYRAFDFDNNVAWIKKDWLTLLNNGSPSTTVTPEPEPTPVPTPTPDPTPAPSTPDPTPEVTPQPTPDSTPDTTELPSIDENIFRSIRNISVSEDGSKITIEGIGAFMNIEGASLNSVKHTLILANEQTGEEIELPTETREGTIGVTTQANTYVSTFDISTLKPGNYHFRIRVQNGDTVGETRLYYTNYIDKSLKNSSGYSVHMFSNSPKGYRLDLSVEKNELDMTNTNKPSTKMARFNLKNVSFDGSMMHLDGYSFMRGCDMSEDTNPSINFYRVDEEGKVTELGGSLSASKMDYALLFSEKNDLSKAYFNVDYDLRSLHSGTYRVFVKLTSGEYSDVFEAYNYNGSKTESDKYTLEKTDVRARYELTVK
ncbi:MAG: glucosaminidase domain-containing protein [Bulleidia sp.]|nr:glucosaminidase domain-containing protein [Bulleidia sp.]